MKKNRTFKLTDFEFWIDTFRNKNPSQNMVGFFCRKYIPILYNFLTSVSAENLQAIF